MITSEALCIILFWGSLLSVFQSYFGIYLYLLILSSFVSVRRPLSAELPTLTVLVPAYNEEKIIRQKIESLLCQNYPDGRLNIVIASDCSTDRTVDIVREYADQGVELVEMTGRHGKNGIDDVMIPRSVGEVVVVTDANTMLEPDALLHLVEPYADPKVGAVCGNVSIVAPPDGKNLGGETTYRNFESSIRSLMSKMGIVLGGYGGLYSLRRDLYRPLGPKPLTEDMAVLMEVLAQDYRVMFADQARATEESASSISDEFSHRIRISAFNWSSITHLSSLALKAGFNASVSFFSWKLLRWLSPYFWMVIGITSFLLIDSSAIYQTASFLFAMGLALAIIGWIADIIGIRGWIFTTVYHFVMMNIASFFGLFHWMKGLKIYWDPFKR